MTCQDIIREIQRQNPQISEDQIQEKLEAEKTRTGGLFCDETLLRLIAAKFGVQIQQNHVQFSGTIQTCNLVSGLNDVSVAGRLIAVFPVKTFQGIEKSGKFATMILADNHGILRTVLWDEKAELVECGKLKSGQTVNLRHGYTKQDRNGKTELHLGSKSQIEIEPNNEKDFPIEKFTSKINTFKINSGNVHLCGEVKAVLGKKTFSKGDDTEGVVMRLALRDDTGEVAIVAWNEKVAELEFLLRDNTRLILVNAKVKAAQNGEIEVHVDSNTFIDALKCNSK
jgi:ssDNA-binding replication factor A large subunit